MQSRRLIYGLIPLIVAIDYASKEWALGLFGGVKSIVPQWIEFRIVFNKGVTGGLLDRLEGWPHLLVVWGSFIIAISILIGFAFKTESEKSSRHLGFACMIGGAVANGLNRFFDGHVIDFIHVVPLPIFNLADVAVVSGMIILVSDLRKPEHQE